MTVSVRRIQDQDQGCPAAPYSSCAQPTLARHKRSKFKSAGRTNTHPRLASLPSEAQRWPASRICTATSSRPLSYILAVRDFASGAKLCPPAPNRLMAPAWRALYVSSFELHVIWRLSLISRQILQIPQIRFRISASCCSVRSLLTDSSRGRTKRVLVPVLMPQIASTRLLKIPNSAGGPIS